METKTIEKSAQWKKFWNICSSYLRTLTICTQLGLVKTTFLNVKLACHGQNLLYHLMDHVSGTIYLLPVKSNVPRKIEFKNQLEKHSSNSNDFDYFWIHISITVEQRNHPHSTYIGLSGGSINYPLIGRRTSSYQGVRNVAFSGRIKYILCGWLLITI